MTHRLALLSLALLLTCPLPASAIEVLELDAGGLFFARNLFGGNLGAVLALSPRLAITTHLQIVAGSGLFGFQACDGFIGSFVGCGPGNAIVPSGSGIGGDFFGGTVTLDGITHDLVGNPVGSLDVLSLAVTASPTTVPDFGNANATHLVGTFERRNWYSVLDDEWPTVEAGLAGSSRSEQVVDAAAETALQLGTVPLSEIGRCFIGALHEFEQ